MAKLPENQSNIFVRFRMHNMLDTIVFWPFLIGLAPILLARTSRARRAAILFGSASIGFGIYFALSNTRGADMSEGFRRIGLPIIGALSIALVSVIVTYRLDKKHGTKA